MEEEVVMPNTKKLREDIERAVAAANEEQRASLQAPMMTTYKRADGEPIAGEFDWVSDMDWFDDGDEPTELVKQVWREVYTETIWRFPSWATCENEDEDGEVCEGDVAGWSRMKGADTWTPECADHLAESEADDIYEIRRVS